MQNLNCALQYGHVSSLKSRSTSSSVNSHRIDQEEGGEKGEGRREERAGRGGGVGVLWSKVSVSFTVHVTSHPIKSQRLIHCPRHKSSNQKSTSHSLSASQVIQSKVNVSFTVHVTSHPIKSQRLIHCPRHKSSNQKSTSHSLSTSQIMPAKSGRLIHCRRHPITSERLIPLNARSHFCNWEKRS